MVHDISSIALPEGTLIAAIPVRAATPVQLGGPVPGLPETTPHKDGPETTPHKDGKDSKGWRASTQVEGCHDGKGDK